MNLQQLRYLVTVAQYDSISRAAQSMFVSQSNISKSLKQLESEVGFSILVRNSRGVTFTTKGQEFLRKAYSVIKQFDSFQARYSDEVPQIKQFSVSSQHYIFVLGAIIELASECNSKSYSFCLRERKTSEIIDDIVSRRSQLGFIYHYDITGAFMKHELEQYNLTFHPFCEAMPHIYISKKHPLAQEKIISTAQLERWPYVCYDLGVDSDHFAEEMFSPVRPSKVIYVTDRSSMFNIIQHSQFYTVGSGYLHDSYTADDIITVPLDLPSSSVMHIGWVELDGQATPPEVENFVQRCKSVLDKCYTGPRKARVQPPLQWSVHLP